MTVLDTFHLEDGRTIFTGPIETDLRVIRPCDCEVLVGNEVKASLRIDGEEIPMGKKTPNRSISTSQRLDIVSLGIGRSGFRIRSKK